MSETYPTALASAAIDASAASARAAGAGAESAAGSASSTMVTPASEVREIITADIGGTHARFALAQIADGRIVGLSDCLTLRAADYGSLQIAWQAYGSHIARPLPREAAIAAAGPVSGDVLYFTNSSWMLRPALVGEKLALDRFTLINDFAAVAHAVAHLPSEHFSHICGPDVGLCEEGAISVVGPGTGLGVAYLLRWRESPRSNAEQSTAGEAKDSQARRVAYRAMATEGGHGDFAPLDEFEDRLLSMLRGAHRRVSVERIVAGPGLRAIYQLLAKQAGDIADDKVESNRYADDRSLWQAALAGVDPLASAALDRFCLCLGGVAGDLALAHGAQSLVLAGGLGARIGERLARSGFRERFIAKGRFQSLMENIGVYRLTYNEPGLYGAAAAFINEHG